MQQNLKTHKSWKGMRYLTLAIGVFFLLTFFLPNVNAMYYHQSIYPDLIDNHTMRYYAYIINSRTDTILTDRLDTASSQSSSLLLNLFDLNYQINYLFPQYSISSVSANDVEAWNYGATSDKYPYQFFIKYDMYPYFANTFVNYTMIQYCQINITKSRFSSTLEGIAETPIEQLLYKRIADVDLRNQEQYIELDRGDTAYVKIECYYTNSQDRSLNVPINLYVSTPTYECSKCTAYEWSKMQPTLLKSDFLQQSNNNNLENIKKVIDINYEFFVYLYWIILILLLFLVLGLIFLIIYYLYQLISRLAK
jgi:hypothetical protein